MKTPPRLLGSVACLTAALALPPASAQTPGPTLDSLRALTRAPLPDSTRLTALGELAFAFTRVNPDSAVHYAERAYALAAEIGTPQQRSQAANDRGAAYLAAGRYREARDAYREAIALRTAAGEPIKVAGSRLNLGSVYQRWGRYDSAIVEYQRATAAFEAAGHAAYVDYARNNTAALYELTGDQRRAIPLYHQVVAFRQNNAAPYDQAVALTNLASAQAKVDSFAAAEANYLRAVERLGEGDPVLLATLYNNLSGLEHRRGRDAAALRYADRGLAIAVPAGASHEEGLLYYGKGNSFRDLGQTRAAYDAYARALDLLDDTDDEERIASMHFNLAVLAGQLGRRETSTAHADRYRAFVDSANAAGTTARMLELETQYATAQQAQVLAETRAARLQDQLAARQQALWLLGALAFAVLAAGVGYVLYSQQRLRNRQLAQQAELDLALSRIEAQNQLHEQRLQISRDLHDNIGAQLSFIISGVDNARLGLARQSSAAAPPAVSSKLNRLSEFAGGTVRDLRDTVWAMNKDAVTVRDLRERITNFIAGARGSGTSVAFDVELAPGLDPETALPARVGMNVYRILQEAVHNAHKHAFAKTVHVALATVDDTLEVTVRDDGRGFSDADVDAAEARGGGNGLHTMRQRAADVGAEIEVTGDGARGTTVRLRVPLGVAQPAAA